MNNDGYGGKHVVVTGCASGIGRATAVALTGLGALVHGLDLKVPDQDLHEFTSFDLAEPESILAAVSHVGDRVDAVFNCAGAPPMLDPVQIMKVNFLGTRLLTQGLLKVMRGGSAIANVSSDAAFPWRKQLPLAIEFVAVDGFDAGVAWYQTHTAEAGHAYAFGKVAMNVWTMQQSAILIHRGIRINTVSPGAVQTPMLEAIEAAYTSAAIDASTQPSGRRSSPEEQVGALLFLNSDSASYVNGADLAVDGGLWASLSLTGKLWN